MRLREGVTLGRSSSLCCMGKPGGPGLYHSSRRHGYGPRICAQSGGIWAMSQGARVMYTAVVLGPDPSESSPREAHAAPSRSPMRPLLERLAGLSDARLTWFV